MRCQRAMHHPSAPMLREKSNVEEVATASLASADEAGLRFVADDEPGISRLRFGKSFRYKSSSGAILKDDTTLGRIRSLVIPPAWTEVWICARPTGIFRRRGATLVGASSTATILVGRACVTRRSSIV